MLCWLYICYYIDTSRVLISFYIDTFSQIISKQYLFIFVTVFHYFSFIEYKTEKNKCYKSCYICCHPTLNVRKTYAKRKKVVTFAVN